MRDDERAVSELVGEIMLIGVVIIAFGTIAVSVYSYIDKTPDTPHIEVAGRCDIDSNCVYLKHQGGESINKENLRILVDVGGNTSTFENFTGLWTLGSVIGLSTGNITQNDTVRVVIVHVPSDTVLTSGDVAESNFESTATNIAPSADAGEDQRNDLCNDTGILEVTFDGAGSYDPDGSITRYDWDFGENASGDTGANANAIVTHAYASPGAYTVTLTVTDNDCATASDTCTVTIDPAAPLCANAGPDRWVALGDAVELNGSKSTGCIRSWHWDIGDGSTSSSKAVMHTYGSIGIYNVTLTVEDYSGDESIDYMVVSVLNATVRITDPADGDIVSGTVHVDAHVFGISESMINRVEFFSDSGLIGTDSDGTIIVNNTVQYAIVWDTTDWTACADSPEGVRKISAIVYHSGQTEKSQDVVIVVDNDELPVITIIAPDAGDYVNKTTTIRAIVVDDRNVMNVTFLANGVFRGIMSPPNSFDRNWGYRVPVTVHAGGSDWNLPPVVRTINFTEELASLGASGIIDTNSVRVIEECENGTFICEIPSRVEWEESGCVSAGGITNGGFEAEEGWNCAESRTEWDIGYDNTTSYTGSRSFLIEYPWNQGSSAGDYAKVTQMIRGS
ncbi:MAG: PKD domain-containing protein [Candidatus Methanogasteraceae archaeon]